jgi:hypothetical protein
MTEEPTQDQEPQLVGGNLLNEQDNVPAVKQKRDAAGPETAGPVAADGQPSDGTGPDTITEEQLTHGGGAVPPGSTGEGNADVQPDARGLDFSEERPPGDG